jgi:ATP-dependent Clp protease ATP-binding subunit ClpA
VTVFHVLTLENMREVVRMQLDRVVRTAAAPRIIVAVDDSVVDYAVEASYQPQFGPANSDDRCGSRWRRWWLSAKP